MAVRGRRLWLLAGTGEGPHLAKHFLERGWRLRVSVVTPSAGASYPIDPNLEVVVGALAGAGALCALLDLAERQGDPFAWVIDASHPFATRVTAAAVEATRHRPEAFLRLQRPSLPAPKALLLSEMGELGSHLVGGERLLLAIGARHLREACQQCPDSRFQPRVLPHARVLPHPQALKQAQQAGLLASRIACLHPTADGAVEEALCHHWQIDTILCRQSGGLTEALWLRIATKLPVRLLLLQRPPEPEGILQLPHKELVDHVGSPPGDKASW